MLYRVSVAIRVEVVPGINDVTAWRVLVAKILDVDTIVTELAGNVDVRTANTVVAGMVTILSGNVEVL